MTRDLAALTGLLSCLRRFTCQPRCLDPNDFAGDPFRDWRSDGIANESPSTAVQPSGNPINVSRSFQVKFLAADNRSIGMAALMSASLGANRGANTLGFGIPKAAPTLDQKRTVWINAIFENRVQAAARAPFSPQDPRRICCCQQ